MQNQPISNILGLICFNISLSNPTIFIDVSFKTICFLFFLQKPVTKNDIFYAKSFFISEIAVPLHYQSATIK